MLDYNELYEYLRKEKYSEQLQPLSKSFVQDVADFLRERRHSFVDSTDFFSDELLKSKKQFENAVSLFRELIRVRKRKILNLVFVASETGIMKRDFNTLLPFEQELFELLVHAIEGADKSIQQLLNGSREPSSEYKLVLVSQPIAEFVDMQGKIIGPFEKGVLVNLDGKVADILVSDGRATFVDHD